MAVCDGKRVFFFLSAALRGIEDTRRLGEKNARKGVFTAYACDACKGWHIGHWPSWSLDDEERGEVEANLGIVKAVLSDLKIPPGRWKDCFQEGVIGLAAAVKNLDPSRSTLATFGRECVRNRVFDYLRGDAPIQVPKDQRLGVKTGESRVSSKYLRFARAAVARAESLDAPKPGRRNPVDHRPPPDLVAARKDEVAAVLDLARRHDPRAAEILERDLAGYARDYIAEELGLTRGHVNTIATRAYHAVRKSMAGHEGGES